MLNFPRIINICPSWWIRFQNVLDIAYQICRSDIVGSNRWCCSGRNVIQITCVFIDYVTYWSIGRHFFFHSDLFSSKDRLWTAPELLRDRTLGSTNSLPWSTIEIGQLMKRCWIEEPNERPDFTDIWQVMRWINK